MDTLEFLATVLPSSGKYCAFTMAGDIRKNIFVGDINNLYQTVTQLSSAGQKTWFAMGTFDNEGFRKTENLVAMRGFFMDLDCGVEVKTGAPKAFASKKDAVAQLYAFLEVTGLGSLGEPYLVDSGGGVHVHWPFEEEVTYAEWLPVATALKNAAAQHNFPIDNKVTDDGARVLAMPDAYNHKYDNPRLISIKQVGVTFHIEDFRAKIGTATLVKKKTTALAIPGAPLAKQVSAVATALMGNSETYFRGIVVRTEKGTGCGQLAHYMEHAAEDGIEPLWRGILSWTKPCLDGEKSARIISRLHPYDEDRMQRKLAEIKGPYSCAVMDGIQEGICTKCPHWGKITNPLVFGNRVAIAEEVIVDTGTPETPLHLRLPDTPRGYSYGEKGGVYFHKPSEKKDDEDKMILLVPYYLYMSRMFRDGKDYRAEFVALKGTRRITFVVPMEKITSERDLLKELSSHNIISSAGRGGDAFLCNYVRACALEASNTECTVDIPPSYGWQENGDFAVGDTVYRANGDDYVFSSDRLSNIMRCTRPAGTIECWRSVFEMMRQKQMWGHLSVAGAGFGSILMPFMPAGSTASTLHVSSPTTGGGKSLMLSMCNSIWGDPIGYNISASTSETTMMQRAGLLGNLPMSVDEVTTKERASEREWLPKYLFDFANGSHKIKGQAQGNAEITHDTIWKSLSVLTSNAPALEAMMGARKHTSEGEAKRFIEWNLPRDWKIEWTASEREILENLRHNYGVAGPLLAKWCVRNKAVAQQVCSESLAYWREFSGAADEERFWSSQAAAVIAGYLLCGPKYANILEMPVSKIAGFFLLRVKEARFVISANQTTAMDILHAYIREFNGQMIRVEGNVVLQGLAGSATGNRHTAVRGRIENQVTPGYVDLYIEERMLRAHCAAINRGYTEFVTELEAKAVAKIGVVKNLLSGTGGPTMRVKCLKITRPATDVSEFD